MSSSNSILWLFCVTLCCTCTHCFAQEDSPQSEPELPKYAVHRFGEFGDTPESDGIYRLKYSPDGKLLATRSRGNIVAILDTQTKKTLCEVDGHDNNWIETIDFSPDSKYFITAAGSSEKVKIWNSQTGKLESEIDTDATAAYFDAGGEEIHVLGETHVESYSWPGVQKTGQRKWKSQTESRAGMSRDGRMVFSYKSLKRQIFQTQLFDLETKSKVNLDGPTSVPKLIVISPNQLWAAAVYHRDSKIRLWDLRDPHNKKYTLFKHDETAQSISFSNDNRFLISSGWDEKVFAWDILTKQIVGEFNGHSEHVNATAFSPLDFTFATGASGTTDCSTVIWDMKDLVVPKGDNPQPSEFESAWNRLGLNSLNSSIKASSIFIESKDEAVKFFESKLGLQAAKQVSDDVSKLIDMLNSPDFEERQNATNRLIKMRAQAETELRSALKHYRTAEIRYRLGLILKKKIQRPKASILELRRWHRIVFALEQINTDASQDLLSRIANGHPNVDIASDAKDAFRRNVKRAELGI